MRRLNVYVCPGCGRATITVDVDEGVTPFLIPCGNGEGCASLARSCMYSPRMFPPGIGPVETLEPTHEWYKPRSAVTRALPPATRQHVESGGLLLRKIDGPRCMTVECGGDGECRVHWPSRAAGLMCRPCSARARGVAEAMGFDLVVEVLTSQREEGSIVTDRFGK